MAKEYERTCRRCGRKWYLPKALKKERKPNKLEMLGSKMTASGANLSTMGLGGGGAAQQAANLQAKHDRVVSNSRCPDCGSTSFTERKA